MASQAGGGSASPSPSAQGAGAGTSRDEGGATANSGDAVVDLYVAPGAAWVGGLKFMSISASCMSLLFLPVAAYLAPAGKLGAAAKVLMSASIATVAVSTTALLTVITRTYVHSIRCSAADAAALDAPAEGADAPPDMSIDLVTFNVLGRKVATTVHVSDIVWPEHDNGFFSSFSAAGRDFFVHDAVVKSDARLQRLFPKLAAARDAAGPTPLVIAAQAGLEDEVRLLLRVGADIEHAAFDLGTPLFAASEKGHADVARALIDAGAAVDVPRPADGATPLVAAAEAGHAEVATMLLGAGADVNGKRASDGATALLAAAENGHTAAVKALLKAGADIEAKGSDGYWTPLLAAESAGHGAVADALRKARATRPRA